MRIHWGVLLLFAGLSCQALPTLAQKVPLLESLQAENSKLQAELATYRQSAAVQQTSTNLGTSDLQFSGSDGCCDGARCTPNSGRGHWFDACCKCPTVAVFTAGDGWGDFSEFSYPNNFGTRIGLDTTRVLNDRGLRGQLGAAYAMYDLHGRFTSSPRSTEQQFYFTAGVYRQASGVRQDCLHLRSELRLPE